jgi:hypothetical protein
MHPVIEEFVRVHHLSHIQNHAFRRWQRVLRDEISPEFDRLVAENALLKEQIAALEGQRGKKEKVTA